MRLGLQLLILTAILALLALTPAAAQNATGALYVTVVDDEGTPLPGVSVGLEGIGARRSQLTDPRGQVRFLNLEPGARSADAALDGFSTLNYPNIDIRAGRNTTLEMQLSLAVEDQITVSAQTPLLDERKISLGTVLSDLDLEKIPTAGDPWALVNQSQGVLVDHIDVGGSLNQQSQFTAPAVGRGENEWMVDGVEITNQAGGGGFPISYFDMGQYAQVEIGTGGNEISKAKPGVSINLVTRRGGNEFRGSARYLLTDDSWQSSSGVDPGEFPPGQIESQGNRTESIDNYGLEFGGPAMRDRLWFWGSYGNNEAVEISPNEQTLRSDVEAVALKLNGQISKANSAVGSWTSADKQVADRGAAPNRAPETLIQQRGPGDVLKIEDTHVFSSSFFLTGYYSKVDSGFTQVPNGCLDAGSCDAATEMLLNDDGVWVGSWVARNNQVPSEQFLLDGSYFFGSARTSHELKIGARKRDFEVTDFTVLPGGRGILNIAGSNFGLPDGLGYLLAERNPGAPTTMDYTSVWAQDTISSGAWTFNVGLRYDHQEGKNPPFQVEPNPAFPGVIAPLDFPGDSGVGWETISPRIGLTYALGEERKTLLRASYSRFAGALSSNTIARLNPVGYSYAYFLFEDLDLDDRWAGPEEPAYLDFFGGFDPSDPSALVNPNLNDPDLGPELTDEIVLGAEHAIRPELVVGANINWRNRSDIFEQRRIVRDAATGEERVARREDYVFYRTVDVEQPDGQVFGVDYYRLGDHASFTGGSLLTNGDREVDYLGASLSVAKRLSQGWMLRGFLNFGESEWSVPASFHAFDDPTRTGGDKDGEIFGQAAGRFNSPLVLSSGWSFNVNGLYQVAPERRWGFDVSGNIYGREGYPIPYRARQFVPGSGRVEAAAADSVDSFRYENILTTDLGISKDFPFASHLRLTVQADLFNVFNEGFVFERNPVLTQGTGDFVVGTLSPRIWRLGARVSWR